MPTSQKAEKRNGVMQGTGKESKHKSDQDCQTQPCTNPNDEKGLQASLNKILMPNKKDTILLNGKPVIKRHLLCSKRELYRKFKRENQGFSRKFTAFCGIFQETIGI